MKRVAAWIAALAIGVVNAQAPAQDPAAEMKSAVEAARKTMQAGPADVKLGDQAILHLPAKYDFIPQAEAVRMLKAMGNRPSNETLGMVVPKAEDQNWFVVVRYVDSGYIKDDDAKEWNADELLQNIREGTAAANEERRNRGMREIEVVGWVERPAYDAASHRLVWSMSSRDKGASPGEEQGINYNTYLLGRHGYVSMNLVTGLKSVEGQKPMARELLSSLEFDKGKSYADFNSSTDRIAEYGLAALVGGVAAKKLGLFALIAAFAVKFAKVILLGLAAIGTFAYQIFKKKKEATATTPPQTPGG